MQNIVDKAWNGAVIIRKIHGADAEQYAGLGVKCQQVLSGNQET
ncbi:hypothetical protein [Rubrivivax gelatinosus]|nr:hypothetical protein [Rubrivivax gelatinosus]